MQFCSFIASSTPTIPLNDRFNVAVGRTRQLAGLAWRTAEFCAVKPAELGLVAEAPFIGYFANFLMAVWVAQHLIAYEQPLQLNPFAY